MEEVLKGGSTAVFVFLYLFPGFVGTLVYDFLVEGQRPENFERVVATLSLTLVTSAILNVGFGLPLLPPVIDDKAPLSAVIDGFVGRRLAAGVLASVVLAAVVAVLNNSGFLYRLLGRLGLTYKASARDVWSDMLRQHRGDWVRVNFTDGRSLVGWPKFYSKSGDPREMFLADATWSIPGEDGAVSESDVAGPGVYLADFAGVASIELLE